MNNQIKKLEDISFMALRQNQIYEIFEESPEQLLDLLDDSDETELDWYKAEAQNFIDVINSLDIEELEQEYLNKNKQEEKPQVDKHLVLYSKELSSVAWTEYCKILGIPSTLTKVKVYIDRLDK